MFPGPGSVSAPLIDCFMLVAGGAFDRYLGNDMQEIRR